ncbi:hypothetical protein MW887_003057 [Aspergillus wentii]|nr:hypothetical protein MW887_003057 [Aspergillus wentii]
MPNELASNFYICVVIDVVDAENGDIGKEVIEHIIFDQKRDIGFVILILILILVFVETAKIISNQVDTANMNFRQQRKISKTAKDLILSRSFIFKPQKDQFLQRVLEGKDALARAHQIHISKIKGPHSN